MDLSTVSTASEVYSETGNPVNPPNGLIAPSFYQSQISKATFALEIKLADNDSDYNNFVSEFDQITKPSIRLLRKPLKNDTPEWFAMTYPHPPSIWPHPFPLSQSAALMDKLTQINSSADIEQKLPIALAEVVSNSYFKQVFEQLQKDSNTSMSVKLSFGFSVQITHEALPENFPNRPCTFMLTSASGGWQAYYIREDGGKPVSVDRPPITPDPLTKILPDINITSLTDKQAEDLRALFYPDFIESFLPTKLPFYVEVKSGKSPDWVELPHYEFTFAADAKTGEFRIRCDNLSNTLTKNAEQNKEEFIPSLVGLAFDSSGSKFKGFLTRKSEDPKIQKEYYSWIGSTDTSTINSTVQKLAGITFEKRTLQDKVLSMFMDNAKYAVSLDHSDWLKNFLSENPPSIENEERKNHIKLYKDFYVNKFFVPYSALGMLKINNPNFKLKNKPELDQQKWLQDFFDNKLPKDPDHTVCLTYANRLACLDLSEDLRNCTANNKGNYWAGLLHEYLTKSNSLNLITTELLTDSDSRMARYANLLSVLDPNQNFSRNFLAKVYYVKLFREINDVDFSKLDDKGREHVNEIIAKMIEKLIDSTDKRDAGIRQSINEYMKQNDLNKQQAGFQLGVAFTDFLRFFQNKNQGDFVKNIDETLARWSESGAPSKMKLLKTNFFRFLGVALAVMGLVFSFVNWDNLDALGKASAIAGTLKVVHTALNEATMAYKNWMLLDEYKGSQPRSIELADMGRQQPVQNEASNAQSVVRNGNNQRPVPTRYRAIGNQADGLAQNGNRGVGSRFRQKTGWDKFLAWSGIILSVIMLGLAVWQLVNYFVQGGPIYKKILQSFYIVAEVISLIVQALEVIAVNLVAKFASFFFWAGLMAGIAAAVITLALVIVELFVKDDSPFDIFMKDTVIPGIVNLQAEEKKREAEKKAEEEKKTEEERKAKEDEDRPKRMGYTGVKSNLLTNTFNESDGLRKILDEEDEQIVLLWNKMKILEWNEEIERQDPKAFIPN